MASSPNFSPGRPGEKSGLVEPLRGRAYNPPMSLDAFPERARAIAARFAVDAAERAARRALDPDDFAPIIEAGYLLCAVPESHGGWFRSLPESIRPLCDSLRALASGDGCVALVAAMHPAVLIYWCIDDAEVPAPQAADWLAQRERIFTGVRAGALWGTVTSEPGSGGDIARTRTRARKQTREPAASPGEHHAPDYALSGDKHFGTGSGMSQYMVTTAVPEGEERPEVFFVNIKDSEWDGSSGVTLTKGWNAHGMMATQSHAFRFQDYPAERIAWPGRGPTVGPVAGGFANALFSAAITGVLDTAMATARARMRPRLSGLRAYEQVAWQRAENDYWTVCQAYEGMLAAIENKPDFVLDSVRAKTVIAELAESAVNGVGRAMGGGAFTRYNPLGQWSQDIKALGFLRPPWGLAFDHMSLFQSQSGEEAKSD